MTLLMIQFITNLTTTQESSFEICIRRQAQPEQFWLSFLSFCLGKFVKKNVKCMSNRLKLLNLPNQKVRNENMGTKKDNSI